MEKVVLDVDFDLLESYSTELAYAVRSSIMHPEYHEKCQIDERETFVNVYVINVGLIYIITYHKKR